MQRHARRQPSRRTIEPEGRGCREDAANANHDPFRPLTIETVAVVGRAARKTPRRERYPRRRDGLTCGCPPGPDGEVPPDRRSRRVTPQWPRARSERHPPVGVHRQAPPARVADGSWRSPVVRDRGAREQLPLSAVSESTLHRQAHPTEARRVACVGAGECAIDDARALSLPGLGRLRCKRDRSERSSDEHSSEHKAHGCASHVPQRVRPGLVPPPRYAASGSASRARLSACDSRAE